MSDTNAASLGWIIRVTETGREYRFRAGESVIIGRTPLRPSVNEADRRLDIDDPDKSMSKKHVRFEVKADGTAVIRDLHSTNGTYIVRADGDLMRLPLDQDYSISRAPLKLQFGDVRIELHREVRPAGGAASRVTAPVRNSNLFAHAAQVVPEGVDSPSLSVDDILDVRAGEPTEMFNAHQVRKQVMGSRAAALQNQNAATSQNQDADGSDFARLKQDLEEQSRMQREFLDRSSQETASPLSSEPKRENFRDEGDAQQSQQSRQSQQRVSVTPVRSETGAVFEPGSVFDRLTRGEMGARTPAVEIGNLNSNDAQRTSDQTVQFEMAKHRELLPFLAMNPYLYDDLYAWLEAIGDPDISSALASNSGYTTYREGRK